MGNWRTVNIIGHCPIEEVKTLEHIIDHNDYVNWHCLCNSGSLCGLGNWAGTSINVTGNLSERDYSVDAVEKQLRKIANVCRGLELMVHCGDEYENLNCVATLHVKDGTVTKMTPQISQLSEIGETQIMNNLAKHGI